MNKKSKKMPKEILVYVCDYDNDTGEPIFAVAKNVSEIPYDTDGEIVGNYTLNSIHTFNVKIELK
jgi:hypothetical protein